MMYRLYVETTAHHQAYGTSRLHGTTHMSSEYCPAPEALRLWSVD
jgi:hypothetical protein